MKFLIFYLTFLHLLSLISSALSQVQSNVPAYYSLYLTSEKWKDIYLLLYKKLNSNEDIFIENERNTQINPNNNEQIFYAIRTNLEIIKIIKSYLLKDPSGDSLKPDLRDNKTRVNQGDNNRKYISDIKNTLIASTWAVQDRWDALLANGNGRKKDNVNELDDIITKFEEDLLRWKQEIKNKKQENYLIDKRPMNDWHKWLSQYHTDKRKVSLDQKRVHNNNRSNTNNESNESIESNESHEPSGDFKFKERPNNEDPNENLSSWFDIIK